MTSKSHPAPGLASWASARLAPLRDVPVNERTMVLASFVASLGGGLYVTGSNVYFVRSVGLSANQVGIGMAAATLLGLTAGIPVGRLCDRAGARNVLIVLWMACIPSILLLTRVGSFWAFLPLTASLWAAVIGAEVARGALMAHVAGTSRATKLAMYSRSAFNAGWSVGLLGAGIAISIGTRPAYLSLFIGAAATMILNVLILLRIPQDGPAPSEHSGEHATAALRDFPYMLVAQVSGLIKLGDSILTIGLPIWIVTRTAVPRGLASWLLIVNTLLVVVLQVRATRRANSVAGAAQIQRWAFIALALACLSLSPTGRMSALAATALLLAGTVLLTFGEIWGEGAWWSLRYNLASPDAQGAYGAAFALGQAAPGVLGPVIVTSLAIGLGTRGWLILVGLFLGCASINAWPVKLALRQRATHKPAPSASVSKYKVDTS
jgi:hypothetical protein